MARPPHIKRKQKATHIHLLILKASHNLVVLYLLRKMKIRHAKVTGPSRPSFSATSN